MGCPLLFLLVFLLFGQAWLVGAFNPLLASIEALRRSPISAYPKAQAMTCSQCPLLFLLVFLPFGQAWLVGAFNPLLASTGSAALAYFGVSQGAGVARQPEPSGDESPRCSTG